MTLKSFLHKAMKQIPVISPDGRFHTFWNILLCILTFYNFITISFELFFDECWSDWNGNLLTSNYILTLISLVFFSFDILIKFNTGFYDDGSLVLDRRGIVLHYMKYPFWVDSLTLIPLMLCPFRSRQIFGLLSINTERCAAPWLKMLFFIKLYQLEKIYNFWEEVLAINEKIECILMLLKLVINIIFMIHLFACLWHLSASFDNDNNWLVRLSLNQESWVIKYIYSLYWSAATIITVGYGDVIPQNSVEVILSIGAMIFGCGVFGYSLNNLGTIITKYNKSETELKLNLKILSRYMRRKNLDQSLQTRVKRYFEFIWNEEESLNEDKENALLNKLSKSLKEEVLVQTYGKVLAQYPLFCSVFSDELLIKTVHLMKTLKFSPEETIFTRKDDFSKHIYFVVEGEVELFVELQRPNEKHFQSLKILGPGEILGEKAFFTDYERSLNARSIGFSTIFAIDREDFINLTKKFPSDYEKFCIIKDKLLLYKDSRDLSIHCFSCGASNHFITDCPCLSYNPSRDLLIRRYIFSEEQIRNPFNRKRKRWRSPLGMLKSIKRDCEKVAPSPNTELDLDAFPQLDEEVMEEEEKDIGLESYKKVSIKENTRSSKSIKSIKSVHGEEIGEPTIRSNSTGLKRKRKSSPSVREDTNKLCFGKEEGTQYENSIGSNNFEKASYVTAKTLMTLRGQTEPFTRAVTSIDNNDMEDTKKSLTVVTSSGMTKRTDTNRLKADSKKMITGSDDMIFTIELLRMDKIHNFVNYFPHNNCETILRYFELKRRLLKNKRISVKEKKKQTITNGLIDFYNQQRFYQKEIKSPTRKRGLSPKSRKNNIFTLLSMQSIGDIKTKKFSKTVVK